MTCCAVPDEPGSSATWVGTITTEGNVTTVVNESGSVWGGNVGVNETLSIGVESGDEPYLLGEVRDIGVTADRIYILDSQISEVRVYDLAGSHLFDVGRSGDGPGEFARPWAMGIDPDGRLIVQDYTRVSVFDLDGGFIETWPYRGGGFPLPLAVTEDGRAFVPWRWTEGEASYNGVVGILPDGSEGARVMAPPFDAEPWGLIARSGGNVMAGPVTYAPAARFGVLPSGAIVRGISDTYGFEIEHADGRRTIVERAIDLPPVSDPEREWLTKLWTKRMRSMQPDWTWNANPVPVQKPAFDRIFGDRYGRVWVWRAFGTDNVSDCVEDPTAGEDLDPRSCWQDVFGFDVFDEETGRFLGEIELPARISPVVWPVAWPEFVEDGFLIAVEDDAGTIMVKRYRLVLPGER